MHFFAFNIGDYASHTRHLTNNEDLAYRRLLDLYYLHEQPLNECTTTVARLINMRDNVEEVETVLNEFFVFADGLGWTNVRVEEEIEKYRGKLDAASRAGKASAQARLNNRSTAVQLNKKHETINNPKKQNIEKPDDVDKDIWLDFLVHRKNVKAPLTTTALNGIIKEADKANMKLEDALALCQVRGWRSFKADWVKDKNAQTDFAAVTYHEGVKDL
tara:strand:+ start:1969 stop:2619 length:651 start_codon:yes stop_codon:yes gene_type:complete